jgi:hypothetical protein
MIVDIHNHVGGYKPEVLDVRTKTRLNTVNIDPEDQYGSLVKQMDKVGVDMTGIMSPNDPDAIKKYSNRLFGISGVGLDANGKPNIEKVEHDITSLGWKALKFGARYYANDFEKMDPIYKKAIDLDIPCMWHIGGAGHTPSRKIFSDPDFLNEVAFKYRDLKIVVCHLGETGPPGQEQEYIELAMTYPNFYIEASAVTTYWMWRAMPPMNPKGPPEMDRFLVINRNFSFMNSDKLGETKPYLSKDPRMNEAWRKIMEKHQETIRSCALQCPNKFMFATDGPFAMRQDIALNLYRKAFADDKELLNKILGENAKKLYKL